MTQVPHYSGPILLEKGWQEQDKPIPDARPVDCVVLGIESSGIQWMTRLLYLHPDLYHVHWVSYPNRAVPLHQYMTSHTAHIQKHGWDGPVPDCPPLVVITYTDSV
jgi:hypothetical protein